MQFSNMFSLCINGFDCDPDQITAILGLQPTSVVVKGEMSAKSGHVARGNAWHLDVFADRLFGGIEHDTAMTAIVALLSGRAERFARLRQEVRPEGVTLYGGLYHRQDEQCGIWLNPEQMRVLADCQVEWGLDIFTVD